MKFLPKIISVSLFLAVCLHAEIELTRVAEIRALTREQAAEGRTVRVRGVITFASMIMQGLIVQDEAEGIFVKFYLDERPSCPKIEWSGLNQPKIGMLVEVSGVSMPGGFAPCILATRVKHLGTAPLPAARPVSLSEMRAGVFDCQWVEVGGVVQRMDRAAEPSAPLRLEVATQDGTFSTVIADVSGLDTERLLDANVRVTGPCSTFFNSRGEALGINLMIENKLGLVLSKPEHEDPFLAPEVSQFALRPFRREPPSLHRQRLLGTVTLARPGRFLYVQTKGRGFRVNTRCDQVFAPGDAVEASGFIAPTENFAVMDESLVRKTGRGQLPAAVTTTCNEILTSPEHSISALSTEDFDGRLIALRGRLIKIEALARHDPLAYLDCDGLVIVGTLGTDASAAALARLQPGSEVEATGICVVRMDFPWPAVALPKPASFSLLLQDPESLHVVHAPSWWTRERILWLLGGLALLLACVVGWVLLLGRTVRYQATRIEGALHAYRDSQLESQAARRERRHLAADLHDGLQQFITGASFRFEAALMLLGKVPVGVEEQLSAARAALESTRSGLRECLLGLNAVEEGPAEFTALLRSVVGKMEHWPNGAVNIVTNGEPFFLSRYVMGSLLLFMQEAVSNALHHGTATHVTIRLDYLPEDLQMSVEDDGSGFDLRHVPAAAAGHFGLESMRYRLRWLGGSTEISSQPGQGTRIIARLAKSKAAVGSAVPDDDTKNIP